MQAAPWPLEREGGHADPHRRLTSSWSNTHSLSGGSHPSPPLPAAVAVAAARGRKKFADENRRVHPPPPPVHLHARGLEACPAARGGERSSPKQILWERVGRLPSLRCFASPQAWLLRPELGA